MWYNTKEKKLVTEKQIRKAASPATLPKRIKPENVVHLSIVWVENNAIPPHTAEQKLVNGPVILKDGIYVRSWGIIDFSAEDVLREKTRIQDRNKMSCKQFITAKYPLEIQSSAQMGLYGADFFDGMADHISRIIGEENRVHDLLEAEGTMEGINIVKQPEWPEE